MTRIKLFVLLLFMIGSYSFSMTDNNHKIAMTAVKNQSDNQGLALFDCRFCYGLTHSQNPGGSFNYTPTTPFRYYIHIPVLTEDQCPVLINEIRTTPQDHVLDYKIVDNYSGTNALVEVTIGNTTLNENFKVIISVSALLKFNNSHILPEFIGITSADELPDLTKNWLYSTEFIQADHPQIIEKAQQLKGNESNLIAIAQKIGFFTSKEIIYGGESDQDALSTLENKQALCTGKATLGAALFRALGVPARVLLFLPTHYYIEFYAQPNGWIKLETNSGMFPAEFPTRYTIATYCVYPEDENSAHHINGESPFGGIVAYWGTSIPDIDMWGCFSIFEINEKRIFCDSESIAKSFNTVKEVWKYYSIYTGQDLSKTDEDHFVKAGTYQTLALHGFRHNDYYFFSERLNRALDEYNQITGDHAHSTVSLDSAGSSSKTNGLSLKLVVSCLFCVTLTRKAKKLMKKNNTLEK
ncbi:MAG: transglutaminase family protein [Candidatus Hodarchaeota archaeon]